MMNFFKRALRAVTRRKVKSLLLLVIFFVIANLLLAGFAIRDATDKAKSAARSELGATLTLSFDQQKAREEAMSAMQQNGTEGTDGKRQRPDFQMDTEPVTEEMALLVAGLEHVQAYNYIVNASGAADDFDPVETGTDSSGAQDIPADIPGKPDGGGKDTGSFTMPDVTVVGVYASALYSGFSNGDYTLEEGEHILYDADNGALPALVEKTLAAYNNLSVGDTLTVSAMTESGEDGDDGSGGTAKFYTLTITGIYSAGSTDTGGGFRMGFNDPSNQLIVDYKTALDLKENTTSSFGGMGGMSSEGIDSAIFYLDDPLNADAVIEASKSLAIDWDTFTLDANSAAYESMIAPLDNVASFSAMLVIVVAMAGVSILALILAMWVRERMYETGVLLSLGESKWKVAAQYVCEALLVAVVACTLSVFSGMFISQKLGDLLVAQTNQSAQVSQPDTGAPDMGGMGMPGGKNMGGRGGRFDFMGEQAGINRTQPIDSLTVSVGWKTIAQLYGIGLLLVLAATVIPAALVMRYKPKSIFTRAG